MRTPQRHHRFSRCRTSGGFTLLEVVLAILIAVGILVVALFFYQQSASFRTQLIEETERLSTIRLVMDRMTSELRMASRSGTVFRGGSNFIEFVKTDLPMRSAWSGGALGRNEFPESDLKLVRYRLDSTSSTNVSNLIRTEEPLTGIRSPTEPKPLLDPIETGSERPSPLTQQIRLLDLKFWNGTLWQESWNAIELPQAVNITLSAEPLLAEGETNAMPEGIFRRTVYLAGSKSSGAVASEDPELTDPSSGVKEGTP